MNTNDIRALLSYLEEKYDEWYTARSQQEKDKIEQCVYDYVISNMDVALYAELSNGNASGLLTPKHFRDDLMSTIQILRYKLN